MRVRQAFDLHVCYDDPNGDQVVAFDVYHRWSLPECRPGTLYGNDFVVRCECRYWRELDNDDLQPVGVSLHYTRGQNKVRFRQGRKTYRFRFTGTASGGNCYWEIIRFPFSRQPHVLNWLRRTRLFRDSEWLTEFESIWRSPRPLTVERLHDFGAALVRQSLKHEAELCKCSVAELIRLSMIPHEEVST